MSTINAIHLRGLDKSLPMSRVSKIKLGQSDKEFIYLDKLADGTWRLCYTEATIPDLVNLTGLIIGGDPHGIYTAEAGEWESPNKKENKDEG